MKKLIMMLTLIMMLAFNQVGLAVNENTTSEKTEKTASEKATSTATIGFTEEKLKDEESFTPKPTKRLPTTGETLGMGASFLGMLLIIIIFRKDLKNMIINKKNKRRE